MIRYERKVVSIGNLRTCASRLNRNQSKRSNGEVRFCLTSQMIKNPLNAERRILRDIEDACKHDIIIHQ